MPGLANKVPGNRTTGDRTYPKVLGQNHQRTILNPEKFLTVECRKNVNEKIYQWIRIEATEPF